jgi:hypothetical protein
LWRFVAFCGVLWRFAAFCGVLQRFAVFCGVLRRFAAFCGILWHFAAFCGVLRRIGNKFPLQDKIFGGGSNPRPLFLSVENNRAKMGGQWPRFPPENIFSGTSRKTLDSGKWGGILSPPPKKQVIMRISDLECFSEYFSSFIYYSYMDTFLACLKSVMIRQAFLSFEKRKILGEEGVSIMYKILCGWLSSHDITEVTRKYERFHIVSFFLTI